MAISFGFSCDWFSSIEIYLFKFNQFVFSACLVWLQISLEISNMDLWYVSCSAGVLILTLSGPVIVLR